MKVSILKETEFIPKWNENSLETDPVKFHLRYLTTGEIEACIKIKPVRITGGDPEVEIDTDSRRIFELAVMRIDNLEIEAGGKITTAKELMDQPGFNRLYNEVLFFIQGMNAHTDKKK